MWVTYVPTSSCPLFLSYTQDFQLIMRLWHLYARSYFKITYLLWHLSLYRIIWVRWFNERMRTSMWFSLRCMNILYGEATLPSSFCCLPFQWWSALKEKIFLLLEQMNKCFPLRVDPIVGWRWGDRQQILFFWSNPQFQSDSVITVEVNKFWIVKINFWIHYGMEKCKIQGNISKKSRNLNWRIRSYPARNR